LAVSAPYYSSNVGRVYAFTGASADPTSASDAVSVVDGSTDEYLGLQAFSALGNIGPGGQNALGVNTLSAVPQRVDARSGSASLGPIAVRASFTSTETTTSLYGRAVLGGGVSGRTTPFSFVGPKGGRSDLAVTTRANSIPRLYIVDGDKIVMPSSSTIEPPTADVTVRLTGSFGEFSRQTTAAPDLDGDGYGDLVVSEVDYGTTPVSGHVLIIH
jgi:hypothetical protein